jgi:outer membrane protein TolC
MSRTAKLLIATILSAGVALPALAQDQSQLRPRGEGGTSWSELRSDNAGFRSEDIAKKFEDYVKAIVAARNLNSLAIEATAGADTSSLMSMSWWARPLQGALTSGAAQPQSLTALMDSAVTNSVQLNVFAELPAIRSTGIDEAQGRYQAEFFTEARYRNSNDPTTSLAQTRGSDRLRETDTSLEFGVRTRTRTGAELTIAQRFSDLYSNQIDYNPREQARSRTTLGVVQPLLRESGTQYNNSVERIAELETAAAEQEFARQAESHLLEISRSYWTLYLARAVLLQQQKSADAVTEIVERIQNRKGLDTAPLQLSRARAVLAERNAELVRARNAVRNAEARVKALINAPELTAAGAPELVPGDIPGADFVPAQMAGLVQDAIANRPELRQAFTGYRTALLREGMAANEALPQLDLILEGSMSGGDGDWRWGGAFGDQWEEGAGYQVGVRFAVPLGKDERRARLDRRKIESHQQRLQVQSAIETVLLELEVSGNEYVVAHREMLRRMESLRFANDDQRILRERWQAGLAAATSTATDGIVYLDQLLSSQERVSRAERELVEAQATFQVAASNLSRARGTLLRDLGYKIVKERSQDTNLPVYRLVKG